MYLQVSTKCNMSCKHCMYSCRPGIGKHMPLNIFKKAIDLAHSYDAYITIGGGEPTLHPKILWMLGYAGLTLGPEKMFMVTNGTCSKQVWKSLMVARETKMVEVVVSDDPWHDSDMVKDWVEYDANEHKMWWGGPDRAGARGLIKTRTFVLRGRAKENIEELEEEALYSGYDKVDKLVVDCLDPRIDPYGMVWADLPERKLVGPLSDETISKAYELIREWEEDPNTSMYYREPVAECENELQPQE